MTTATRESVTTQRLGVTLAFSAIVALWALGWLPSAISLLSAGRGYISGLESTATQVPLATAIASALTLGTLVALVLALIFGLPSIREIRPGPYLLLLAMWLALHVLHGLGLNVSGLLFPLLVGVWMLLRPPVASLYRLLAWLGFITAAGSILFAVGSPLAFMVDDWSANSDKAIIGDQILAGPYSHSNALGLTLALTLPIAAMWFKGRARLLVFITMVAALVWSASRLSIASAVVTLLLSMIAIGAKEAVARALLSAATVVAALVVVALPLLTTDPTALTHRGFIWMQSLAHAPGSLVLGYGADIYRTVNNFTTSMGYVSTTGHNTFVTLLLTGGLLVLAIALAAGVIAFRNARASFPVDRVRLLFLAVLLATSFAEDPLRALALGPLCFVLWPMTLVLLDTSQQPERTARADMRAALAGA